MVGRMAWCLYPRILVLGKGGLGFYYERGTMQVELKIDELKQMLCQLIDLQSGGSKDTDG